ncbi:MAG: VWA domain-containing protein [Caldilineaceae bacterium]|nr:VWA domain-containing protein [Caldilineaceae bacterium]
MVPNRPGGELASRPLHFIWMLDCSGSMNMNGKIQQLNQAIKEALPHMRSVADENPSAKVLVRAITFSNGARWHVANPTPLEDFRWADISADGLTDMGKALKLVADQLKIPPMESRALPPVLVLVSDGQPTDDYKSGLQAIKDQPWGQKAVRIAIAIGADADVEVLSQFIDHPEIKPLQANSPQQLTDYIRWASTVVLKQASSPANQADGSAPSGTVSSGVAIPMAQITPNSGSNNPDEDVW